MTVIFDTFYRAIQVGDRVMKTADGYGGPAGWGWKGTVVKLGRTRAEVALDNFTGTYTIRGECLTIIERDGQRIHAWHLGGKRLAADLNGLEPYPEPPYPLEDEPDTLL